MPIGDKIKKYRTENGLKQSELADKVGISRITLGFYERGENQPPFDVAVKIANALELSITKLLDNPYDIFRTPEFVIDEWLYSHGYKMEYDREEGGMYLVDTSNNMAYELENGQLKHLEQSISDYTKFQVQELLKNCRCLPTRQKDDDAHAET